MTTPRAAGAPPGPIGASAEGVFAVVFNARPYAAFFTPVPAARPDDGVLDALVLKKGGVLDLPRWAWKGRRGTLASDESATVLRSTLGLSSTSPTSKGIGVAIIDSGIQPSTDFEGRFAAFYDYVNNGG